MTSNRSQNVSVPQRPDIELREPSITVFSVTREDFRKNPRNISLRTDKNTLRKQKSFGQNPSINFVISASQNRDRNASNEFTKAIITNGVGYSGTNSADRELSPVRWCDREVDGIYLGRSGWVQIQQRSLDDCKEVHYNANEVFSTVQSQTNNPDLNSDCKIFYERRRLDKPSHLPLSPKKRIFRDTHARPSKFTQDFEPLSLSSTTPVISPPPAFKDGGSEAEFSRQTVGKSFFCQTPFLRQSDALMNDNSFPNPPIQKQYTLSSSSSAIPSLSSTSSLKHQRSPNQDVSTISLEGDRTRKVSHGRRLDSTIPLALFGFRSLDNDTTTTEGIKVKASDFVYNDFVKLEKESEKKEKEEDDYGKEETFTSRPYSEYLNSSCEELSKQRFLSKAPPQECFQNIEKISLVYKNCDHNRVRPPSLDSNSSSSGSSCSSNSFSDKKSGKRVLQKMNSNLKFKIEKAQSKNLRRFNVKRSKSLQLSNKKSSNESLFLNKSTPPESLDFQLKNGNKEHDSPERSHHVLVKVNGESIPIVASCSQSLKSLNKLTISEVEQKKLIMEMEKEAKIISDFMSGSRSRLAARNLLMDRYFNRYKDEDSTLKDSPRKKEHDTGFLPANQNSQNQQSFKNCTYFDEDGFKKKKEPFRSSSVDRTLRSSSVSQTHAQSFCKKDSGMFFRNNQDRKKMKEIKNQESERSHLGHTEQTSDYCSRRKIQNLNLPFDWTFASSKIPKKPKPFLGQNQKMNDDKRQITQKQKNKTSEIIKTFLESDAQSLFMERATGIEEKSTNADVLGENSLFSSSSSNICEFTLNTRFNRNREILKKTHLKNCANCVTISNSSIFPDLSRSRPGSAPEKDFWVSNGVDKRSLSLPRSFLSECYKLNNSDHRDLKQYRLKTSNDNPDGRRLHLQDSKIHATTSVRDARSSESLYEIPTIGSSRTSLSGETSSAKARWLIQEAALQKPKRFPTSSSERSKTSANQSLLKISAKSSETAPQKFGKRSSLKHLNPKFYLKGSSERISQESEDESFENSNETLSVASGETFKLPDLRNEYEDIPRHKCRFIKRKDLKNEMYDSHDSGIQIINRGNVDSSESQDTDIQEEVDSPFASDLQKRSKCEKHSKGVTIWRSNSGLSDERLLNSNVKHCKRNTKTMWKPPVMEDLITFVKYEKLLKPRLRRSLSQPLGLNESCPENVKPQCSILKEYALSEDEKNLRQRNAESELLSDSESSVSSLSERKKSFDLVSREETIILAEALWDNVAMESCELPFKAGDLIEVLDMKDRNWWWGATTENNGYFPSAFVRLRVSQADTVEDCLAEMTMGKSASKQFRRGKSLSLLSNDQVRSRIVKELLNTERDFVKILRDVKDGFVVQCKQKTDMFTSAQITTIFSNLEDLLLFQERFLKDLEAKIDRKFPYKSCFGEVFLNHVSGFRMYSEYCNSHPMAIATLQDLYQENKYCKFFESCRLKQRLIEIPLDGYLLTPVQRICKYPLQLGELLKYTRLDHPDYKNVRAALETMRSVATLINERKRKMESLEKLAAWQQRVEGWEGEDLIEISSQLIYQGDVIRITSRMWTSNITLFLFDHQIVYCKKDILKKNVYIYKGRFLLEESDVIDLPDGKNQQLGINIKFGLKINSRLKNKWLVFCCKSSEDKFQWLEALANEKRLVAQDKEEGLNLPTTAKQLAKMAAREKKRSQFQPKGKNKVSSKCDVLLCRNNHPGPSKTKSIKRMGTWFTFGEVTKSSKASLRSRASGYKFT